MRYGRWRRATREKEMDETIEIIIFLAVLDFGVKDLVTPKLVREGEMFTITIGFVNDDIKLDSDFVLGYSISIMEGGCSGII